MDLNEVHIAELEEYGLPLTVINRLESKGISSLRELLDVKPSILDTMRQIGPKRRRLVIKSVQGHRAKHGW